MRFRLGLVTGFASGYYLGTRAGRQRYDQINRQLTRLRRSEAFDEAADRARTVVTEGVEKARSLVDSRSGSGPSSGGPDDRGFEGRGPEGDIVVPSATSNGQGSEDTASLIVPGQTTPESTAEIIVPPGSSEPTDPAGTGTATGTDPGGYSSSR